MRTHRLIILTLLTLLIWLSAPLYAERTADSPAPVSDPSLVFVENVGQFEPGARFMARAGRETLWLAEDGLWITVESPMSEVRSPESGGGSPESEARSRKSAMLAKGANIKVSFVGAAAHPVMEPFSRAETRVSYFRGRDPAQWHAAVPVWSGVVYRDLYPGIDLQITSRRGGWMPCLQVRPGADLSRVRLRIEGAQVDGVEDAAVRLSTPAGDYGLPLLGLTGIPQPVGRARLSGRPDEILDPFVAANNGLAEPVPVSSHTSPYAAHDLIFSTFLGGSGADGFPAMVLDAANAVYMTGMIESVDMPTTPGVYDPSYNGGRSDAFVAKLSADGADLLYATYLGGVTHDGGVGIAVDAAGAAYVAGYTRSADFPITAGTVMTTLWGYSDSFVTKLAPSGAALVYSTFLGGGGPECPDDGGLPQRVCNLTLDAQGDVYFVGTSGSSDFPTTPGAYDPTYNGGLDAVVAVLNPTGSAVLYGTYLGGSDDDWGTTLVRDAAGALYVMGPTLSGDFPATPGAFSTTYHGGGVGLWGDIYVAKLAADGSALMYATYLGGSAEECFGAYCQIAVDAAGAAYVTGQTRSADFPTTPGAFQPVCPGGGPYLACAEGFVTKFDPTGSSLVYSTFLGGTDEDFAFAIALDAQGRVYAGGATWSADFPTTPDAYDPSFQGTIAAYLTRLSPDGSAIDYSTFLGGAEWSNYAMAVALDRADAVYLGGVTTSSDFPTTPSAYDPTYNGSHDLFVAKLAFHTQPRVFLPAVHFDFGP